MMQQINDFLLQVDRYFGGSPVFVILLLGTGIFFTIYLGFPQIRYFRHALSIVTGKYDRKGDKGDTSHFQALTTALSGTVGTGNIAGVALAIYLGGPAALFWMLVTASLGMTTKFVEVLLSHKYREVDVKGKIAGGPMYYMKSRLNIQLKNKKIKSGYWLGAIFAVSTIFCSFGTGSLPQINSISNVLYSTFGINHMLTGAVLAVLLGLVIIGGIGRIAKVTASLVPTMAVLYFLGAISVLITNYQNILPAIASVFNDVFTGSAAAGGFLGASIKFAMQKGVNRGLFSNEAGQGSAPIAHAAARAHEPVSEGMVAILEPFIDTIIICTLTGLTILSSGVWKEKHDNRFQPVDTIVLQDSFNDTDASDRARLKQFLKEPEESEVKTFSDTLEVAQGIITNKDITVLNSRSVAEDVIVINPDGNPFTGQLITNDGKIDTQTETVYLTGKSLLHSAPLTAKAFTKGVFGDFGQYLVSIGLLLFAFSTAISWSYYGDRAVTYLWSAKYVTVFRIVYVIGFFIASFADTTVIWTFSGITIALMAFPNLIGLLLLHKEIKSTIVDYWKTFREENQPPHKMT